MWSNNFKPSIIPVSPTGLPAGETGTAYLHGNFVKMEKLTFDKVPQAIETILVKLEQIENILALKKQQEDQYNEIMDVKEAARFLKLAPATVYTKVSRSELPAFKSGKRLLFNKSKLLEYMQLNKKMSAYQLKKEADLMIRQLPNKRRYSY